jgi:hypothetical protein
MKKIIFLINLFFLAGKLVAQQESDVLYHRGCFGGGCLCPTPNQGVLFHFNEDSLVQIIDPACLPLKTFYSSANFAHRNTGELLFAYNGWRLINGDGQILSHKLWFDDMPHPGGTGDTTLADFVSGPLFLTYPGDSTKAYLFYGQLWPYNLQNISFRADKYFTYALLDIPSKSLISKNNLLLSDTSSMGDIQACRHANGRDWWIIKPDIWSNKYFIGLLTPQGIEMTSITLNGVPASLRVNTSSKFNIQGTKYIHYNGGISRVVHEFDFDRCTGTLSNFVLHDISDSISSLDNTLGSMSISPDGSKFYIKRGNTVGFDGLIQGLYQLNLETDSMFLISRLGYTPQMTPNGKKILFREDSLLAPNQWLTRISEIENPNSNFNSLIINKFKYDTPNSSLSVAPNNFAYMRLGADTLSICDSLSVITKRNGKQNQNSLVLFPNPANQQLNLTFEKSITGYISITDALGKVVYSYTINNPIIELPIDIANFSNGIYYLSYRNKEVSIHKKFIKQ